MDNLTIPQALKSARRVSTPLIAIRTADPAATVAGIAKAFNGGAPAMLQWDIVQGCTSLNEEGKKAFEALRLDPSSTTNLVETLSAAASLPPGTILFVHNSQRYMESDGVPQAIWNLRDRFKQDRRTLVLLCPSLTLPAELSQDVLMLDEALPNDQQLTEIANSIYADAKLDPPDATVITKIVDATLGLASFPAEQSMAMCLAKTGMDIDRLWTRKKSLIEQTPGLSVWSGGEKFSDIGGCGNVKAFLSKVLNGIDAPRGIVFIDEIEKGIGTGQDTSGVSQSILGTLLTEMQDTNATGILFIGVPGAAKSALSKAAGNEAGIPTIAMDMGGMKASLVGESEARLRMALKVIRSVTQNRALFIATCNSVAILPPELRRRFTFGSFMFGLPVAEERAMIWAMYLKKAGVPEQKLPPDEGWTGAEIKQCVDIARRTQVSLVEAAGYIVPVAVAAKDRIHRLCLEAHDRYISASYPGLYRYNQQDNPTISAAGRKISFEEDK